MEKKVLVLNLDHTPVAVVNAQKAVVLTFLDKAMLLARFDHLSIRTVDRTFHYPAVIRLHEYKNIPYQEALLNRHNIFKRDQNECQYCGAKKTLTIDHVIPKSKGGKPIGRTSSLPVTDAIPKRGTGHPNRRDLY
jgi:5-methylcytosine-specific restriction endonuclease McrA